MAIDLNSLTPDDLDKLKAALGIKTDDTRSPMWKPLRDLRPPQTAKGRLNRPHFEWSADEPPEGVMIPPFPRLYWDQNGVEVRIETADDMDRVGAGWTDRPPMANAISEQERVQAELNALSPEDRALVFAQHKDAKLARLKEAMLGLSAADVAALTAVQAGPVEVKPAEPKVSGSKQKTA